MRIKLSLLFLILVVLVLYQNCGDVTLTQTQKSVAPILAPDKIAGQFCSGLPSSSTQFTVNSFGIINLTAVVTDKVLKADSDADGVADSDESFLGTDPILRRTHRIFDGLCSFLGGVCSPDPNCDMTTPKGLLLTQCDLDAFSGAALEGIDADHDFIPDFVEILRGIDPQSDNWIDDDDGDQENNLVEIRRGSNPTEIDDDIRKDNLLDYSYKERLPANVSCPAPNLTYEFSVKNLPLAKTLSFVETGGDPRFPLSHDANENVLLIYYISSSGPQQLLFAKTIKIRMGAPQQIILSPSDFISIDP